MLAIIIPYYKLTFFERTLIALSIQTDKRFNVYIGDDNAPKSPKDLIEKYSGKLNLYYKKFHNNLGSIALTKHWERCIGLSKDEEWLMILGDDDVIDTTLIASFYENLNDIKMNKSNVVRFASVIIDDKDKKISEKFEHPKLEQATDAYMRKFNEVSRSSLSEHIFSRTVFNKYGFSNYSLAWYSDDKAWLDFSGIKPIYAINCAIVYVRRSLENISGRKDNLSEKLQAKKEFLEDVTIYNNYAFNKSQKELLLFEYGLVIKQLNIIAFNRVILVFWKFIAVGALYNGLRFIRRMYRAKLLGK